MTYFEKVAAIATGIAPILKPNFDPEAYAVGILEEAEGDHFEVRGLHTKTGSPRTFRIQ